MQIPEHPDIAMALRTGYPHKCESVQCADCSREFFGDAVLYESEGELVCGECLKNRLFANYSIADIAAAFDVAGTTVAAHLEQGDDDYGIF